MRAGETIYVPGGTLHSFGPDTLIYEIEQTSDVQQHATRWNMQDGSPVPDEDWHAGSAEPLRHFFATAQILTNVGAPVRVRAGAWDQELGRAQTLLLPAAVGEVEIAGPADVLLGYLPDLTRDVIAPLSAAGYSPALIAALGEGLEPPA
ncbi:hypothetical protein V6S67_07460 [Arthrobacter sp. Soc17.1.1.1]|uniref:hypothetical protein n=1 Tax=Arthrobacter sp. Soc17.1.1.1 TaxID=3121277 RepID=UPI002FE445E1